MPVQELTCGEVMLSKLIGDRIRVAPRPGVR
jgi:hypothetical protein